MAAPLMVTKLRGKLQGRHVRQQVFIGPDHDHLMLAGELMLDLGEWQLFGATLLLGAARTDGQHEVISEESDELKAARYTSGFEWEHPSRCPSQD